MLFAKIILASFLLAAPAFSGKVWVVGPPPAPYQDLQDTILLAQDGDVVLVKAGSYETIRTTDHSVAVIAENGSTVQIPGAIRVIHLPAAKSVLISGLHSFASGASSIPELSCGLYVKQADGQVIVQNGTFSTSSTTAQAAGARLEGCAGVSIVRSTASYAAFSGPAVAVSPGTLAAMHDVQTFGGNGYSPPPISPNYDGGQGGNGISYTADSPVDPSFLFLSGCQIFGGSGGAGSFSGGLGGTFCGCGGRGGDGILGNNPYGQLLLLGTSAVGGTGGPAFQGMGCPASPPGPNGDAIHAGPYNWCFGSAVSNAPATPYTQLVGTVCKVDGSTLVRDDQLATLTFSGQPGEIVEMAVSSKPTFAYLPASAGVLHVSDPIWVRMGIVGGQGSLVQSFKMRDLPLTSPGLILFVQARFRNALSGATRLSNAHGLVVVDKSY